MEESGLHRLHSELRVLDGRRAALESEQAASRRAIVAAQEISADSLHQHDAFRRYAARQHAILAAERTATERKIEVQLGKVLEARRKLELLKRLRAKRLAAWTADLDRELEQQAAEAHLSRIHTAC